MFMTSLLLSAVIAATGIARGSDPALTAVAQTRAAEMVQQGEMGDHRYLAELNNGRWDGWGEVLGWNRYWSTPADAVASVVQGWVESPTHNEIIFDRDYTRFGCAIGEGRETEYYFVCIFGVPASDVRTTDSAPQSTETSVEEPLALPDTAMR